MNYLNLAEHDFLGRPVELWILFIGLVLVLMVLDLFVLNRRDRIISTKESLVHASGYVSIALAFGAWLWSDMGPQHGADYFTAYLIELSLSLDNLFVMSVILSYFAVPREYQHRVLFWGIMGVLVMRGIMIAFGTVLINTFDWVLFFFAAFLVLTGFKMLFLKDQDEDLKDSALVHFFEKHLRFTRSINGHDFFVRLPDTKNVGKTLVYATPLFMALICIEFMDVIFALDSVPAVFAITTEPFVVYTSNIFAILGLRTMYFTLASMLDRFKYLKYAMSVVLIFIGVKVFYSAFFEKIPPFISLSITLSLLFGGVIFSLIKTRIENGKSNSPTLH